MPIIPDAWGITAHVCSSSSTGRGWRNPMADLTGYGLSLVTIWGCGVSAPLPMRKGLLLILLTQLSAAPADRTNKLWENLLCRARTGWRGWSWAPGRMKLLRVCSMSKGALARLTGAFLQQKSWLLPLEMGSKCSCCLADGMGKGWGRTLTQLLWLPIQPGQSLHSPSARVMWDLQKARLGPAGWGSEQGQPAVPDFLPLCINQHFSESQTWFGCGISTMRFRN